ncbi:MAG: hypothetical protein ED557_01880 [Balneola sp.]|nr:MAG: hypothetical protein ED557_01880 [Balneola sp.]
MRKRTNSIVLSLVFVSLFFVEASFAQNGSVTFPSSELQQMALRYSGNSLNWPVLVNLADHDISSNSFTLTRSDLLQLESFSRTSSSVTESQEKIKSLISSGATIFAKEELNQTNTLIKEYIDAVQTGEIETAIEVGNAIPEAIVELESTLNANRLVQIQAQLAEKTGNVDKRLGLLGGWEDAFEGDLFKESDGLRTFIESYASLEFTDGSSITVEPSTVAVIRKSRIDKLDESADTEISLVQGGLLAKLSAAGKERSKYILNAGASTSELKTQNFYAESDGQETVKLTNYDGTANVSANDVTITIRKNEGTIVREGEPPAPPIELLPSPELAWASSDTVIYNESIIFPFRQVEDAVSYRIEYSTSSSFSAEIKEITLTSNSARIGDLPLGTTFIRVQAIDNLGLRGPFSEVTRVIRNVDNQPPAIFLEEVAGNIVFTLENSFLVQGVTEPDARVEINNVRVPVQASGRFIYQVQNLGVDQTASIKSIDGSGNVNESKLRIVRLTEDVLFNLSLTGSISGNSIRVNQPTVTMSSKAYPELEVIIINEGTTRTVQTDSQGRWGITMNMQEGELSITFKGIRSGVNSLTKSFTVEAN